MNKVFAEKGELLFAVPAELDLLQFVRLETLVDRVRDHVSINKA